MSPIDPKAKACFAVLIALGLSQGRGGASGRRSSVAFCGTRDTCVVTGLASAEGCTCARGPPIQMGPEEGQLRQ
jgi:hypothetical protein